MKLTTRDRALAAAIGIINRRADEVRRIHDYWCRKGPPASIGAATERSAYMECELLARLISEQMSPAGREYLATKDTNHER